MACVHGLFGDPEFSQHLKTAPEHHYLDPNKTIRRYGEMHTGNWWWSTQVYIMILLANGDARGVSYSDVDPIVIAFLCLHIQLTTDYLIM